MTKNGKDQNKKVIKHTLVRAIAGHKTTDLSGRMLVFVHLPKCAGRTFSSILDKYFVANRTDAEKGCWIRGTLYGQYLGGEKNETLVNLESVDRNSVYLRGHLPVGVFEDFANEPAYITMIRDPVAQLVSMYRFGVERGGWENGAAITDLNARGLLIDNPQTRQLAGLRLANQPCNQDTLDQAVENLKKFLFVGKVEHFEQSLQAFLSLLGGPGFLYHSQGIGMDSSPLPDISDALYTMTNWDRKLYEAVPDLETLSGTPLPDIIVDSLFIKPKGSPTLSINERELPDIQKILIDQGHTLTEKP
ncbi:MAG: hypothetical protein ACJZ9F_03990 [Rhodospirillaceae bacterium]